MTSDLADIVQRPKAKVLYVPNEAGTFRQLGFRRPFANLLESRQLGEVSIFSLQWRIREGGDPEKHRQALVDRVKEFQPDFVLMQHVGSTGLGSRHFRAMRDAAEFRLIYHEADPYSRFLHPLPRSARIAGKYADVVFTVGTGVFADNFRRTGAADVRWSPHVFESERFRQTVDNAEKQVDVVVVANRNQPRFRGHPNWKDRIAFVRYLQGRFGSRLALYGHGWDGVGVRGPIDFSRQTDAIRSGWISANWDHYADEPSYFSNRLPISLSAGSIHATSEHPGYASIFGPDTREFLLYGRTFDGLGDSIENVLHSTTVDERLELGRRAQRYANDNFRQDNQLVSFLNFASPVIDEAEARASWDPDVRIPDEV